MHFEPPKHSFTKVYDVDKRFASQNFCVFLTLKAFFSFVMETEKMYSKSSFVLVGGRLNVAVSVLSRKRLENYTRQLLKEFPRRNHHNNVFFIQHKFRFIWFFCYKFDTDFIVWLILLLHVP